MSHAKPAADAIIASVMSRTAPKERAQLLREIMAHAAAGLVVIVGNHDAAEHAYRLADAVAVRGNDNPTAWTVIK